LKICNFNHFSPKPPNEKIEFDIHKYTKKMLTPMAKISKTADMEKTGRYPYGHSDAAELKFERTS
jgi:hypothetical protein